MSEEKVSIEIPKSLADAIAKSVGDDSKEALADFITIVLQNYLENDESISPQAAEDAIQKRLKDLGYL